MNQYEKVFRNFCHKLIDMSPEERYCFLTNLGFKTTLEQCQAMGNRNEMITKMEELVLEVQDNPKIHTKTKIPCVIDDDIITLKNHNKLGLINDKMYTQENIGRVLRTTNKLHIKGNKLKAT